MTEIRLAIRRLMSRRAALAVAVATLAIAIGAGAATWSLLSAVLLNPLPVRDAKRLAMVGAVHNTGPRGPVQSGVIYPYYPHVAASGVFASTAVWLSPLPLPVGTQKASEATPVMFVSAAFFEVLGLTIPVGRAFSADEDQRGAALLGSSLENSLRCESRRSWAILDGRRQAGDHHRSGAPRFSRIESRPGPGDVLPLETIADVGPPWTNYFADPQHTTSPTSGVGIIRLFDGWTAASFAD